MTARVLTLGAAALAALIGAEAGVLAAEDGAALFARQCAMCHLDPNASNGSARIGPPLAGIVGRKAASNPDYTRYSAALRNSGKVWTEAALMAYLAAPGQAVPGTTMTVIGTSTPAERSAIIAYLKAAPAR